jgi:hypothetical protein
MESGHLWLGGASNATIDISHGGVPFPLPRAPKHRPRGLVWTVQQVGAGLAPRGVPGSPFRLPAAVCVSALFDDLNHNRIPKAAPSNPANTSMPAFEFWKEFEDDQSSGQVGTKSIASGMSDGI